MSTTGAAARRRRTQSGQEILEFGLVAVLLVPMLIGAFVVGMNLIRSIQCNQVCRDLDSMYIHGGDFSTYPLQQEAQRLAQGLNLQIGGFLCRKPAIQFGQRGQWIGNGHANHVDRIDVVGQLRGRATRRLHQCEQLRLHAADAIWQRHAGELEYRQFGDLCPAAIMNSSGIVQNYVTNAQADLTGAAQTNMQSLWQVGNGTTTPLTDGQVVYVVETYFQSPDLSVGSLAGNGVYARYFF